MATTRKQTEITQATVARGKDKATGETFYVVRSDSSDTWHHITWNNARIAWECDGEHCQYQAGGTTCKHTKAVLEVLKIRRATIALAMGGQTPAIVAKLQAEEDAKLAAKGTLQNFANRREIKIEAGVPMR